jgi:predicted RNase H-like nuclease (RuvC/YqgF family)
LKEEKMIERWTPKIKQEQCAEGMTLRMWTDKDGDYILYADHLAALEAAVKEEKEKGEFRLKEAEEEITTLTAENEPLKRELQSLHDKYGKLWDANAKQAEEIERLKFALAGYGWEPTIPTVNR